MYLRHLTTTTLVIVSLLMLAAPSPATDSVPPYSRTTEVTQDQLISVTAKFGKKDRIVECLGTVPGTVKDKNGVLIFTSLAQKLKKLRRRFLNNSRLAAKFRKNRKFNRSAKKACKNAPVSPTPTPAPTGTPAPTPTPVFDANGNVTPAGKTFLGIPAELEANIDTGENAHNFNGCSDCHGERTMWLYPQLEARIELEPMFILVPEDLSRQDLADIVAYLNRFRTGI